MKSNKDIGNLYTGLRPGEKLYEGFLVDSMNDSRTCKERIFVEKPQNYVLNSVIDDIIKLEQVVNCDTDSTNSVLKTILITYIQNND